MDKVRNRAGRWRVILIVAVGLLVLCTALVLAAWSIREARGRDRFLRRVDELRQSGVPVDDSTLDRQYQRDTIATNTDAWLKLLEKVHSPEFDAGLAGVPTLDSRLHEDRFVINADWEYESVVRKFVVRERDLLDEIHDLASKHEPVNLRIRFNSFQTDLESTQRVRRLARMVRLEGMIAIRDRDGDALTRCIETMLGLAKVSSKEPYIVSALIGMTFGRMGKQLLQIGIEENLVNDPNPIEDRLRDDLDIGDRWRFLIESEMATAIPGFLNPAILRDSKGEPLSKRKLPARSVDGLYYVDQMTKLAAFDVAELSQLKGEADAFDSQLTSKLKNQSVLDQYNHLLTYLLLPAVASLSDALIENCQENRLALVAMEIRRFEKTHRRFPTSLAELGAASLDWTPIGTKPFGYDVDGEKAVLWGFSLKEFEETPDVPPSTEGPESQAERNKDWVWRLKAAR